MQVAPSRAQLRCLAGALAGDPGLLTSGRPQGPPQIELLIRALLPLGAQRMILPGCAHCGQPRRLVQCDGELRICSACDRRRRGAAEPCAVCGNTGQVAYRGEHGYPRCARCRPYGGPEPVAGVIAHVSRLDPRLDQARLREVIGQAVPQPFQQHQVLWELDRNPRLLTGDGAHGSPRINVLIHALLAAGAAGIVAPACPSCGRTVRLSHRHGEQRCCRRCYDQGQLQACSRCRQPAMAASRTGAGEPVCAGCFRRDPANHGQCGDLLSMRPREAVSPDVRRHAALRALLTPDAPRSLRPVRPRPGGLDPNRRRPAAVRFLQPPACSLRSLRPHPHCRRPAPRRPSSVIRTITDRRRCRSMPTICRPPYAVSIGASLAWWRRILRNFQHPPGSGRLHSFIASKSSGSCPDLHEYEARQDWDLHSGQYEPVGDGSAPMRAPATAVPGLEQREPMRAPATAVPGLVQRETAADYSSRSGPSRPRPRPSHRSRL